MQTIREALQQATFYTDDDIYVLIKLPARAITVAAGIIAEISEPFTVLIVDKDEVSLVLEEEAFDEYHSRLLGHVIGEERYSLITIDVALEPTLVGFMAHISTALGQAGIPIFPYAAYTRDHLLVPANKRDTALTVLNTLKQQD